MIRFKDGVPFENLHPRITDEVFPLLERLYSELGVDCWITATSNGQHKPKSLHFANPCRAIDVRTRNLPRESDKTTIRAKLAHMLGSDYDVLYENPGGPNQHLHIELDIKEPRK
ncbi:MAG TPA: hypothetical protein VEA41_18865 [Salinarimonas sp.]|nr:hypothetical protein [Salinarimonas sp.]